MLPEADARHRQANAPDALSEAKGREKARARLPKAADNTIIKISFNAEFAEDRRGKSKSQEIRF